jgi:signal peptidase
LITGFSEAGRLSASISIYLVHPLLWTSLALMGLLGWMEGVRDKPRVTALVMCSGALAGVFQIAVFMLAGFVFGFGHSPYARHPLAVLGNIVHVASILVAFEVCRACILGSLGSRKPYLALVLASVSFTFLEFPINWLRSIDGPLGGFRFVGETLLPGLSENLLASFLALTGGPLASLVYRGLIQGFEWLSPILPRLQWTVTAFLGTVVPALGLVVLRNAFLSASEDGDKLPQRKPGLSTSWVVVGVIALTMLWFNSGMFGVRPSIVNGVSMVPAMKAGDLAIMQEVELETIQVGDIIQYRRYGDLVLHRVVRIEMRSEGPQFITRGDANNVDDDPVPANAVMGKVVLVVPKVGWIGMAPRLIMARIGGSL